MSDSGGQYYSAEVVDVEFNWFGDQRLKLRWHMAGCGDTWYPTCYSKSHVKVTAPACW